MAIALLSACLLAAFYAILRLWRLATAADTRQAAQSPVASISAITIPLEPRVEYVADYEFGELDEADTDPDVGGGQ